MHSPAFVGKPQCNGVIERFIRTLGEPCLWLRRFKTLAEACTIIGAFIRCYNEEWIIERLDYRTPAIARQELAAVAQLKRPSVQETGCIPCVANPILRCVHPLLETFSEQLGELGKDVFHCALRACAAR